MGEKNNPTLEEIIRMRIVFTVPGMDAVNVQRNVVYKTAGDERLHMDVYSPPGPVRPRPGVILIHGGPIPKIGAKDMGVFVSWGELLAASGFIAVAFDHRFLSPARISEADLDVSELLEQVRRSALSLGIDAERLAIWAFSGGGSFLTTLFRERPRWLRAVVAYYALLDLQQPPPELEGAAPLEVRQRFSAICGLGNDARSAPPMLIARAGLDLAWLNSAIDRFVQNALAAGATLDLLNHPNGRHGFDVLDDDARSKQIIKCTLTFLGDHLAPEEHSFADIGFIG